MFETLIIWIIFSVINLIVFLFKINEKGYANLADVIKLCCVVIFGPIVSMLHIMYIAIEDKGMTIWRKKNVE